MILRILALILTILSLGCTQPVPLASKDLSTPAKIRVAAAANLQTVLPELVAKYKALRPTCDIDVQYGSSGVLVQQILYGAEYDVFLSADAKYALQLVEKKKLDPKVAFDYAQGRIMAIVPRQGVQALTIDFSVIAWGEDRVVAIANPELAPYGRAAMEVLKKVASEHDTQPQVIYAPDASSVLPMVATQAADIGLTAASLQSLVEDSMDIAMIPEDFHQPIRQVGVVLTSGHEAIEDWVQFLQSDDAQSYLADHGYTKISLVPPKTTSQETME